MSEIIQLADRRPRPPSTPRTSYHDGEAALRAMRAALDSLADACAGATAFWPTKDTTWGEIAKAGLQSRLRRIGADS